MLDFHEGLGCWLAGRLAGCLAGWLAGSLAGAPKCVKNAYPSHESASKMRTLRQKVDVQAPKLLVTKCTCPLAAFLSNKLYSRCSISTRAWAAGWLGGWLAGWAPSASKTRTLSTKVRGKCVPLGRKSTSKPLSFWDTKMRQKRVPLARKCVENAYT